MNKNIKHLGFLLLLTQMQNTLICFDIELPERVSKKSNGTAPDPTPKRKKISRQEVMKIITSNDGIDSITKGCVSYCIDQKTNKKIYEISDALEFTHKSIDYVLCDQKETIYDIAPGE